MRKKFISTLLIMLYVLGTLSVNAANIGDVVNSTLYTDIVASINNYNIESYNIDGYTAVVAEDLRSFGFDVEWRADERALYITRNGYNVITSNYTAPAKDKSRIGQKVHDVLYTDIKTYINGKKVTSYNIGGRTIIYFDDLGVYGKVSYDNNTRKIDLTVTDGLASKPVYLMDVCPPYDEDGMCTDDFKLAGNKYDGFYLRGIKSYVLINLTGKYLTANMIIGPIDGTYFPHNNKTSTINFYLDGKKTKFVEINEGDYPIEISVPLNNARQLKIENASHIHSTEIGFGNITLQ